MSLHLLGVDLAATSRALLSEADALSQESAVLRRQAERAADAEAEAARAAAAAEAEAARAAAETVRAGSKAKSTAAPPGRLQSDPRR